MSNSPAMYTARNPTATDWAIGPGGGGGGGPTEPEAPPPPVVCGASLTALYLLCRPPQRRPGDAARW
ncbi:MAG: hypothetical protein ACREU6_17945, partial [Steroidobacteraceae bacterium]